MANKMINYLLLALAVQVSLYIFNQQTAEEFSLWNYFLSPNVDTLFFVGIGGSLVVLGSVIVGTIWTESRYAVTGIIAGGFLSFMSPFVMLWMLIKNSGYFGDFSIVGASLLISPLFIYYIMAVVDWWGGTE